MGLFGVDICGGAWLEFVDVGIILREFDRILNIL
jgi:hypothetical protein